MQSKRSVATLVISVIEKVYNRKLIFSRSLADIRKRGSPEREGERVWVGLLSTTPLLLGLSLGRGEGGN